MMTTHHMPGSLAGWYHDAPTQGNEARHSAERVEAGRLLRVVRGGAKVLGRIAVAIVALVASPILLSLMLVLAFTLFPLLPFIGVVLALGSAAQSEAPMHHSSHPDDVARARLAPAA
jgi:hypothetical protein